MNTAYAAPALSQYRSVGAYGRVEDADPHRLVQLLYDGLADALSLARGAIERGDRAAKGHAIGKAVGIMEALVASLDHERGGDVAGNLDRLYDYMVRRLGLAGASNDPAVLDEVSSLLLEVKSAWDRIPDRLAAEGGSPAA